MRYAVPTGLIESANGCQRDDHARICALGVIVNPRARGANSHDDGPARYPEAVDRAITVP